MRFNMPMVSVLIPENTVQMLPLVYQLRGFEDYFVIIVDNLADFTLKDMPMA
jgi:hypothetical protein